MGIVLKTTQQNDVFFVHTDGRAHSRPRALRGLGRDRALEKEERGRGRGRAVASERRKQAQS